MIWIRVTVDPEEQEYTQDRMPVRYQAPYTHTFTHSFPPRGNMAQPNTPTDMFLRRGRKLEELEHTHMENM